MAPASRRGSSVQHNATHWRLPGNHICSGFAAIMAEVCLQTPPCIVSGVPVTKTCWKPVPAAKIPPLFSCKASSTLRRLYISGRLWLPGGVGPGSAQQLLARLRAREFPKCRRGKQTKVAGGMPLAWDVPRGGRVVSPRGRLGPSCGSPCTKDRAVTSPRAPYEAEKLI